jgi:DNA polymerase (family 10)
MDKLELQDELIKVADLKGCIHNHSTYSDGIHTLEEMAVYAQHMGLEYLAICDHSQTAAYAGGLRPEKVLEQWQEIDKLNQKLSPFRILRGIESDILNDGQLDYNDDLLKLFDIVVASVHSPLSMSLEKANARLSKAIENPYTDILGHPTGRLLLLRSGYPIDHAYIIDACVANQVVIELNAHPYRLDLDWRWIDYAINKGAFISINPDAHQKEGMNDMAYGVQVARKGYLTPKHCLNAMDLNQLLTFLSQKRQRRA